MRILAAAVALLLLPPALAQEETVLQIVNQSALAVSSVSGFPLDENGDFIEDNLGGMFDDLPAGATGIARFSGRCGPMMAVVVLQNDADLRVNVNTCKDTAIVVSDKRN